MTGWVNSPAYQAVARALVAARQAQGLSQRDVAARIGKPPSFIARIEIGQRRVDFVELLAILRAIGVEEREVIGQLVGALPRQLEI